MIRATVANAANDLDFRFSELCTYPGKNQQFLYFSSEVLHRLTVRDSLWHGGWAYLGPAALVAWTNSVFDRVGLTLFGDWQMEFFAYDNLHLGGSLYLHQDCTYVAPWAIYDTLFDKTSIANNTTCSSLYRSYNGFTAGTVNTLGGGYNVTNLTADYQAGPLGRFYLPSTGGANSLTNLVNAGSRTAASAGLYHYTSTINQVKETNSTVDIGLHYVALNPQLSTLNPVDTDSDGLADYFEDADGDGSCDTGEFCYTNVYSFTNGLDDLQNHQLSFNVLVNDPEHEYTNEQNTQFETTVAVLGHNVIVGYVDSNRGVYGHGSHADLPETSRTIQFVGYALSRDGGASFVDRDVPPLEPEAYGTAGDPVLAVDRSSGVVYLVGTSPRQPNQFKGFPLWKSTDGGWTFLRTNIHEDITGSDKPWIAVDDWPGTGQHDVYIPGTGSVGTNGGIWLVVSTNGQGTDWSANPVQISDAGNSPIVAVAPNHVAYVVWFEQGSSQHWLKMRSTTGRGGSAGPVRTVTLLQASTELVNGNLKLKRSNTSDNTDYFNAYPFPVVAVNPDTNKATHLYVTYADKVTNSADRADIFLTYSTDGGTNWTSSVRVNGDSTTNDQWMPVIAAKPDGTKLFLAWYDRRHDTNNSLIDVYGRFASIATHGSVSFSNEFRITTTNFPAAFPGTLIVNTNLGYYDPVYPPGDVSLHWWWEEWPAPVVTSWDHMEHHVGEYNGAYADQQFVYITWADNRLRSVSTNYSRNQGDIRS